MSGGEEATSACNSVICKCNSPPDERCLDEERRVVSTDYSVQRCEFSAKGRTDDELTWRLDRVQRDDNVVANDRRRARYDDLMSDD